jgi:hypothetical protein
MSAPTSTATAPLASLYERAIVAAITGEHQHHADVAVRQVEVRRERLTWAAIAFGSLRAELPGEMPEWTENDEPHWPLSDGEHLLLRFGASPDEMRFAVLGRCACGVPVATGAIDPRTPHAVAEIGEALQARKQCESCHRAEQAGYHMLEVTPAEARLVRAMRHLLRSGAH